MSGMWNMLANDKKFVTFESLLGKGGRNVGSYKKGK
jgi:hypothetical protein